MRTPSLPRAVAITALVGVLFLRPEVVHAQHDEKDKLIELLRAQLREKDREIDFYRQKEIAIDQQRKIVDEQFSAMQKQQLQAQADLMLAAAKALSEEGKKELRVLVNALKDREALILRLEEEKRKLRIEAVTHEAQAKIRQTQNEDLLKLVRDLQVEVARLKSGVRDPGFVGKPPFAGANPPPVAISGKIEKIDGDLVMINVGTDEGLAKNHTLEVFRLAPQPKYLGTLRIVEVTARSAVGRLVPAAGVRADLKVGDRVASRLTPEGSPK